MHELSLSESILRAALAAAGERKDHIRALTVKVGALSGASVPTLEFCMELVLEQMGMRGVQVRIEPVPARVRCRCGHDYSPEDLFAGCPSCGEFEREFLDGLDVTLESIEVENGQDQAQQVGPEHQRPGR